METEQTNRVTMFKTVAALLASENSVWNGMTHMVTAVAQLNAEIAAIDDTVQKQETPIAGATVDKATARDALEDVLFLTCEALGVVGHLSHDNDLVALTDLSASMLHRLDDEQLSNRATSVLAEATARKTDLAGLQVTQANLDEFQLAIQAFKVAKAKPRTATVERSAQTESLPNRIRNASGILRNQIDPMVNLLRRSHPDFVARYRAARAIVNRAATHKSPKSAGSAPPANPSS